MIIRAVLKLIEEELGRYLTANYASPPADLPAWDSEKEVKMASISRLSENGMSDYNDHILLDLVYIERVNTLRNHTSSRQISLNNSTEYRNPPIHLNLIVLICLNFNKHQEAMGWLSTVFEFFQSKKVFTRQLSPILDDFDSLTERQKLDFRLIMDHYTPSIEGFNHLWGTLGGKQKPHIFYKARLVEIERDQLQQTGSPIEQIQGHEVI